MPFFRDTLNFAQVCFEPLPTCQRTVFFFPIDILVFFYFFLEIWALRRPKFPAKKNTLRSAVESGSYNTCIFSVSQKRRGLSDFCVENMYNLRSCLVLVSSTRSTVHVTYDVILASCSH